MLQASTGGTWGVSDSGYSKSQTGDLGCYVVCYTPGTDVMSVAAYHMIVHDTAALASASILLALA